MTTTQLGKAPTGQFVTTENIRNLRDFGGYSLAGNGTIVSGRLFRSGDTADASEADLAMLQRMAPRVLADLRGTSERDKAPCRWPKGLDARLVEPHGESARMAFHEEAAAEVTDAATMREQFARRYEDLPFRPHLQQVYGDYLDALAQSSGASLVFCTAGKDRTGFIVAVLQTLLGAHHDDVMDEYLLTNSAPDRDAQVERLRHQIEHRFGKGLPEDAIQVVTRVDPIFLSRALGAVCKRHGSVEAYAADVLRCPPAKVEALRRNFVK